MIIILFRNEEDRQKALTVLDGFSFKGNTLKATYAKAAQDPYQKKKVCLLKNMVEILINLI